MLIFLQVFDIVLNEQHVVISSLDIYEKVGRGFAHDELVPFTITKGKLRVKGEVSTFHGTLMVEFVKVIFISKQINKHRQYKTVNSMLYTIHRHLGRQTITQSLNISDLIP